MNYYLVRTEKLFIDPHGSADAGGDTIEVFKTIANINTKVSYKDEIHKYSKDWLEKNYDPEDLDEDEIWQKGDEDDLEGSEDGYNMIYFRVSFKKITEEKYKECEKTIKTYNKLLYSII